MLGRLSEPSYLRYDPAYRDRTFTAVRDLAMDVINEEVDAGLGALQRLRASLLRRDDRQGLLDLARRASEVQAVARIEAGSWEGERLVVTFRAALDRPAVNDGPVFVSGGDHRVFLGPALTGELSNGPIDVTQEVGSLRADLLLRDSASGTEWMVPSKTRVDSPATATRPTVVGVATVEPRAVAAGQPLGAATWDVWVRLLGMGFDRRGRLLDAAPGGAEGERPATIAGGPPGVVAFLDEQARLGLQVERGLPPVADAGILRRVLRATYVKAGSVVERAAWRTYHRLPRRAQVAARATYRRVRP
jgi:hypothetical protein